MVPTPEPKPSHSVTIEVQSRAEDIYHQLLALKEAMDKRFLVTGRLMHVMKTEKLYRQLGYTSLEDFCLQRLNYGVRQVRTFVRVYYKFIEELQVEEQKLLTVGSTKLAALSDVVTAENVDELLNYALTHNVYDVSNHAIILQGEDALSTNKESNGDMEWWKIALPPSIKDLANETLEIAKLGMGVDSNAAALEAIMADFQSGQGDGATHRTLSCALTQQESNIIGPAIEESRHYGFETIGAFLADAVRVWREARSRMTNE
jgi:hypothetical protein